MMNSSFQYINADERGFKNLVFDRLLEAGYYRMQHLMFTCNETALNEEHNAVPVFWLRTLINDCTLNKHAKVILKKCMNFSVQIKKAYVDSEVEKLYALYKKHVPFAVSPNCNDYLHFDNTTDPFDSLMVQVRHNNKLIATGYFDEGSVSIAGIMNIYHPNYRTYSLGKFLMLQKLNYALSQNMLFYYTGYISTGSTRFDYKTFPDATAVEVYLPVEREWLPYHLLGKSFLNEYYQRLLSAS
jgi:arginyl-tRNA--protein-N-Asp/Glu arginylyltransferase